MEHPSNFLATGFKLTPESWRKLAEHCDAEAPGPGPCETTFTFSAGSIKDHSDVIITADQRDNTFRCRPKPHCACAQDALECQCTQLRCHVCGSPLTGIAPTCEFELCAGDACPLCSHQREECLHEELKEDIGQMAGQETSRYPDEPQAAAYVGAVAEFMAPGVGDAPLFPATIRALDSLLARTPGEELSWDCPDGSRVLRDPGSPAWLTWREKLA